jgi:bacterioferritin-associated ferredoxin
LDQEICLCFHVTRRKVLNFLRVERPRRASQLSECGGAGTGCGWCRPFLEKMFEGARNECESLPSPDSYAAARQQYIREGKGTPPPGGP